MIRERAVRLGRSAPLVGVVSEPPAQLDPGLRPAVVLLNSGILHRVGACRLHVRLARRLAAQGHVVVRFDFSGIGDSEVRRDDLAFEESARVEIREVMDHLEKTKGVDRFVAVGLCSGADMAFVAGCHDDRIVGLGLLDLWVYRTPGYYVRQYGPKLLKGAAWANFLRRQLGGGRDPDGPTAGDVPEDLDLPAYVREFPPRREARESLRELAERGVRLCCIFSGGQPDDYNYQGQFRQAFRGVRFADLLRETHIPGSTHIFSDIGHQAQVIDTLSDWLERAFPASHASQGVAGSTSSARP